MADQVQDRSPDGRPDGDPPKTRQLEQPVRGADNGPAGSEHRKAEAEIAAGDVADDLADFA